MKTARKKNRQPTDTIRSGAMPGRRFERPRRRIAGALIVMLVLALATGLAYRHVADLGFVNVDDDVYVTENSAVRQGLSAVGLRWALTSTEHSNWHPVTWLSHMLDVSLFGMNPAGHHVMNLAFHAVNTILVFAALFLLTGGFWRSATVAALFALHPLHVESVAWVSERKDVLSTFFWFLSVIAYWSYARRPGTRRYLLVLLLFVLGLTAKPMLVTLPFTFLLLDYWPLNRIRGIPFPAGISSLFSPRARGLWMEKVPLFLLAAVSGTITVHAQVQAGATKTMETFHLAARSANALVSYAAYLGKTVLPRGLAVYYPYRENISPLTILGAAVLLAAITAIAVRLRSVPAVGTGWFWYLGTLFPVIGIIQVGGQAMADRYTYVPLLGVFVAVVWGFARLTSGRERITPWAAAAATALLGILLIATGRQVETWRSSMDLHRHALRVTKNNWLAEFDYAMELEKAGRTAEAIEHFNRAIVANPLLPEVHNILGVLLDRQGKILEALEHYQRAVAIDPGFVQARMHLGLALEKLGRREEAIRVYRQVIGRPEQR